MPINLRTLTEHFILSIVSYCISSAEMKLQAIFIYHFFAWQNGTQRATMVYMVQIFFLFKMSSWVCLLDQAQRRDSAGVCTSFEFDGRNIMLFILHKHYQHQMHIHGSEELLFQKLLFTSPVFRRNGNKIIKNH
jgi:hypothetical protein